MGVKKRKKRKRGECFGGKRGIRKSKKQRNLHRRDRILSRMMEEVSVGTKLQIISGADFDAILDRINLGLAKTNNIEKAEAMKQQILDKVYIIKKRLMIGEAAD